MSTPARPILASSLLPDLGISDDHSQDPNSGRRGRIECETWNLRGELEEGISNTTHESVLSCGRVVGISGVYSAHRGWRLEDERELQTCVYDLSLHILASALTKGRSRGTARQANAFVIEYFDCRQFTSEDLQPIVQESLPDLPAGDIDTLVDNVRIYRVFDFDEVLEAVDQVSDILYQQQQQQQQGQGNGRRQESQGSQFQSSTPEPTLLLLEGIDRSLEEVIRASNPIAAHSRLVPLLRTLTVLSRSHSSNLAIVIVNSGPLPSRPMSFRPPSIRRGDGRHEDEGTEESEDVPRPNLSHSYPATAHGFDFDPFIPANSIFADMEAFSSSSGGPSASTSVNSYTALLARSLDQGFDAHLLVSKVQNEVVVEVAKDRTGDGLGRWCVL